MTPAITAPQQGEGGLPDEDASPAPGGPGGPSIIRRAKTSSNPHSTKTGSVHPECGGHIDLSPGAAHCPPDRVSAVGPVLPISRELRPDVGWRWGTGGERAAARARSRGSPADGVPAERTPGEGPAGPTPPVTVSPQQGWWHPATAGEGSLGGVARPCPQAAPGGQGCSPRGGARSRPPAAAPATAGRGRPAYRTPRPTATPELHRDHPLLTMLTARSLLQTLWLQCRRGCCRTRGSLKRKMSVRPRGSLLPDALLRGQLSCLSPHVTQATPCFTRPAPSLSA